MKRIVYLIIVTLFTISCTKKENTTSAASDLPHSQAKDQKSSQPDIRWSVKKERDENGIIFRYDSTFSWSYSSDKGDSTTINIDSLRESFKMRFNKRFSLQQNQKFMHRFWKDSLKKFGPSPDDEFMKMWNRHFSQMGEMFMDMDSIQDRFFKEVFPDTQDSVKSPARKKSKFDI